MVVSDEAHERHDQTPRDHDGWQPSARAEFLEEQIAGDLEGGIREEEECETPVILVRENAQAFAEALYFGVANVSAWAGSDTHVCNHVHNTCLCVGNTLTIEK